MCSLGDQGGREYNARAHTCAGRSVFLLRWPGETGLLVDTTLRTTPGDPQLPPGERRRLAPTPALPAPTLPPAAPGGGAGRTLCPPASTGAAHATGADLR